MSREILFRAKKRNSSRWVEGLPTYDMYGNLEELDTYKWFCNCDTHEVDPDTVCQYTGLKDKYGKKIFEGDIVKESFDDCIGIVKCGEYGEYGHGYYIDWKSEKARFCREDILYWVKEVRIEVIGNIYDNPELLEEPEAE